MITVNLFVGSRYPINRKLLRQTVIKVLTANHLDHAQVDVSVVGERKMRELN